MAKILIVEDDRDTAKMIEKRFFAAGFETEVVFDAYNATAFLRREKPALVVLDLIMPAGGGLTVLKNLRLFKDRRDVPVLVLTGIKDTKTKEELLKMGVDGFLHKPYDPVALVETAKDIIYSAGDKNE